MGWKGNLVEFPVWISGKFVATNKQQPKQPASIFILRNNDIGDLLVITPLFEALHRRFPTARIAVGVGDWNRDILTNNPYVTDILPANAPWNNKFTPAQRVQDQIGYVLYSDEVKALREQHFDIGIDVLGSHVGAGLLMQARIPYRLGVHGYRGGHSAMQQNVTFRDDRHVARSALQFAELLGATNLPECRPQLFMTDSEKSIGDSHWAQRTNQRIPRIVIGPGGGLIEKCWPLKSYAALAQLLAASSSVDLIVVGGKQDIEAGKQLNEGLPNAKNLAGRLTLRETFAVVQAADAVVCNTSMLMHVAAAFRLPTVVPLGDCFQSVKLHEKQWGYPDSCRILGKEGKHTKIATSTEVLEAVHAHLNQHE